MPIRATRIALLGSVAASMFGVAHAQTADQTEGVLASEACVALSERLATDDQIDAEMRTNVEQVIATGDLAQCQVLIMAWDDEGTLSGETMELVGSEQVTERMIVQQEVEVDADVAVYQPPAEVDVDTGTPEISWTMPRQSATINEAAPEVTIRQAQPRVHVEVPQPRVTIMIPEPEIQITWPEPTLDMARVEPTIEVRIPEPIVSVTMPEPIIELRVGGEGPSSLVQREDGRFAPQDATEEDLQPRITLRREDPTVAPGQDPEEPEIVINREDPVVVYETQDPEVTVDIVGEPEVVMTSGQAESDDADAPETDDDAEGDDAPEGTQPPAQQP